MPSIVNLIIAALAGNGFRYFFAESASPLYTATEGSDLLANTTGVTAL